MPTESDWHDVVHTGPRTLAGRYMRSFWQPIYRAQDLAPGRAIPVRVMSEDFTLYRGEPRLPLREGAGEGGKPHLLAFRCAHRGTQLSTGWVEGDDLRCFYHGWKYDPTGQCTEQPAEPESFCEKIRIRHFPTHEYLGLVFAYLGAGEPPPLRRYPELEGEGVLEVGSPSVWPCNYFNRLENSPDVVHLAFVHRLSGFTDNGLVDIPSVEADETEYGIETRSRWPNGNVRVSHWHMPNTNYIKGSPPDESVGWVEHLSWRVPVDDEHCTSYTVDFARVTGEAAQRYMERRQLRLDRSRRVAPVTETAERILRGDLRVEDVEDKTNIVNIEDYVAQIGQGAIADRAHERLGRSDLGVILLRKIWVRELRALSEGRPLKPWLRSRPLLATTGV